MVNDVTTEKYLWDGLTRLLAVFDGSDNLVMRFEYADGRMPVAMTKDGSTYYLTYDQVGSLRIVVDASGTAVKRIDYDSFGNVINDTNSLFEIPFGFAGGLHDRDTGLVRFGFRDYDPDIGRWTAKDPILFAGADTDLYGYCLNDPILLIDPWGLMDMYDSYSQLYGYRSYINYHPELTIPRELESAIDATAKTLAEKLTKDCISPAVAAVLKKVNFALGILDPFPGKAHAPETKDDACK